MESNVSNLLGMARTAAVGGNNAEAYGYFNRVLEIDPTISEAWFGKGRTAGWLSTLGAPRLEETMVAFEHAIATHEPHLRDDAGIMAASQANLIVCALYETAMSQRLRARELYISTSLMLCDVLDRMLIWHREDIATLTNRITITSGLVKAKLQGPLGKSVRARFKQAVADMKAVDPNYGRRGRGETGKLGWPSYLAIAAIVIAILILKNAQT